MDLHDLTRPEEMLDSDLVREREEMKTLMKRDRQGQLRMQELEQELANRALVRLDYGMGGQRKCSEQPEYTNIKEILSEESTEDGGDET